MKPGTKEFSNPESYESVLQALIEADKAVANAPLPKQKRRAIRENIAERVYSMLSTLNNGDLASSYMKRFREQTPPW
jgi:hypothetical protein